MIISFKTCSLIQLRRVKAIDDVVAKEKGAQISYDDEHHSIFAFGKCTVENHATVLNVSPYKVNIWISFLMP